MRWLIAFCLVRDRSALQKPKISVALVNYKLEQKALYCLIGTMKCVVLVLSCLNLLVVSDPPGRFEFDFGTFQPISESPELKPVFNKLSPRFNSDGIKLGARIIGEDFSKAGQFPHHVLLFVDLKWLCGGSLISAFWILTVRKLNINILNINLIVLRRVIVFVTDPMLTFIRSLTLIKLFTGKANQTKWFCTKLTPSRTTFWTTSLWSNRKMLRR